MHLAPCMVGSDRRRPRNFNFRRTPMIIQLNTDKHIVGSPALAAQVERDLTKTLKRFTGRLTRIEVHLSDLNSSGSGPDDKRCVLEARVTDSGMAPVS